MNSSKRWPTLLWPPSQTVITVNLGMALRRLDDGHASSFTVIAIWVGALALGFLVIVQTKEKLAALNSDYIGSRS